MMNYLRIVASLILIALFVVAFIGGAGHPSRNAFYNIVILMMGLAGLFFLFKGDNR